MAGKLRVGRRRHWETGVPDRWTRATGLGLAVDCLGYALRPPSPQTLIGGIALRGKRRLKLARSSRPPLLPESGGRRRRTSGLPQCDPMIASGTCQQGKRADRRIQELAAQ